MESSKLNNTAEIGKRNVCFSNFRNYLSETLKNKHKVFFHKQKSLGIHFKQWNKFELFSLSLHLALSRNIAPQLNFFPMTAKG